MRPAARRSHRDGAAGRARARWREGVSIPAARRRRRRRSSTTLSTRRFARGPRLSRASVGHAAIALRDGSVLVLGGWSGGVPTATAERLVRRSVRRDGPDALAARRVHGDPAARRPRPRRRRDRAAARRSRAPSSTTPCTGRFAADRQPRRGRAVPHTASLLARRPGASSSAARTASTFSGRPRSMTRRPAVSRLRARSRSPRHKHAAVVLRDGRVLVVGGSDVRDFRGRYRTTELWSPATGRFSPAPALREPRFKLPDAVVALPLRRGRRRRRRRGRRAASAREAASRGPGERRRAVHVRDRNRPAREGACSWPAATTTRSRRRRAPGCTGPG